ncbi:MAG: ABC transporter permease [Bacteroidia bacterium]|nr:ABC transporter permease [Bacteroidia bacterium]
MWTIAWRYLWASPRRVIRWLVGLTVTGIVLSTWAWVVVSSVFNGFSGFLEEVFQRVDPHVRIVGTGLTDSLRVVLRGLRDVAAVSGVYERVGVLKFGQRQVVVRIRLVDEFYPQVSRVGHQLVVGAGFPLSEKTVLVGAGVAARAALLDPAESPVWLYLVPSGRKVALAGMEGIPRRRVEPQGIFSVQKEYDESWVISRQQDWPEVRGDYDAIEIRLREGVSPEVFIRNVGRVLPPGAIAMDPRRQHEGLFRILAQEKALARIGLVLLVLLTASGAVSTLSTFLIHNRRDWGIYQALGAPRKWVEGLLGRVSALLLVLGGGVGLGIGGLTVWSQATFRWAKLRGGEGFLLQHFPVRWEWSDILWHMGILLAVGGGLFLYSRYQLRQVTFREALQGD